MSVQYQDHEIKTFFGDYYGDYLQAARDMVSGLDWETIEHYMDRELAEKVHIALAPCDNVRFLLAYMMEHVNKYGEDFAIN